MSEFQSISVLMDKVIARLEAIRQPDFATREFEKFCRGEYRRHPQHIIDYDVWKEKYMDELEEAWDFICQDTKIFHINQ